jgi:hypothetical protein
VDDPPWLVAETDQIVKDIALIRADEDEAAGDAAQQPLGPEISHSLER